MFQTETPTPATLTPSELNLRRSEIAFRLAVEAEQAAAARKDRAAARHDEAVKLLAREQRAAEFTGPNAKEREQLADLRDEARSHAEAALTAQAALVAAARAFEAVATLAGEVVHTLPEAARIGAFPSNPASATAFRARVENSDPTDWLRQIGPALRGERS